MTDDADLGYEPLRTIDSHAAESIARALGGWREHAPTAPPSPDHSMPSEHQPDTPPQTPHHYEPTIPESPSAPLPPNSTTHSERPTVAPTANGTAADPQRPVIATNLLRNDGRLFRSVPPRSEPTQRGTWRGFRSIALSLIRQRRRVALSMLAVALGVGYLAGSLSLLHRVGVGLDQAAGIGNDPADLALEGTVSYSSPLEEVRRLIPNGLVDQVVDIPGVAAAAPRIEDVALIVGPDGKLAVPLGLTERPVGANWITEERLNPYRLKPGGAPPTAVDHVVIDSTTATRAGIEVGDRVVINAKAESRPFTVTGLVQPASGELPAGTSLALFSTETARQLFDRANDDNAVVILAKDGTDLGELKDRIQALMPTGVEVTSAKDYALHRQSSLTKSFALIRALILGFAGLALLVGTFTVANSNTLLFARRRRNFAALRLVGASPSQIMGAAVTEAVTVALAASIIGLPLGLLFSRFIELALDSLGTAVPLAGSAITPTIVATAVGIGIVTTVAATLPPARSATRTAPIVAVTESDGVDAKPRRWIRRGIVSALVLAALAALGWVIGGSTTLGGTGGAIAGAAVAALIILMALGLPPLLAWTVGRVSRLAVGNSRPLRSLSAVTSRSARARVAGTALALFMATLVVACIATISNSFIASVGGQVNNVVTADFVVDSGTFTRGGLPQSLVQQLRDVEGVTAVSGIRIGQANVAGVATRLTALDGSTMFDLVDLQARDGSANRLDDNSVALSGRFADRAGAKLGSTIFADFSTGSALPLRVATIYDAPSTLIGDVIVDTALLQQATPSSVDYAALVGVAPEQRKAAEKGIRKVAGAAGFDDVLTPTQLVSRRGEILRGFQSVIQWMLLFSVLLAVLGVANTLLLGVNERRRELGLLRAVGGSRAQVVRLVTSEALALTGVGSILGVGAGLAIAFGTVRALSGLGLGTFDPPFALLGGLFAIALLLGLLGAAVPAWRAASAGIAEAVGDTDGDMKPRRRRRFAASELSADGHRPFRGTPDGPLPTRDPTTPAQPIVPQPVAPPPSPQGQVPLHAYGATSPTLEDHRVPPVDEAAWRSPNTTPDTSDDDMAIRCYNCGNDPGNDTDCAVCGAPLAAASSDMFSTAARESSPFATNGDATHHDSPAPPATETPVAPARPPQHEWPEHERAQPPSQPAHASTPDPFEPPARPEQEAPPRYERVGAGMWATGTPEEPPSQERPNYAEYRSEPERSSVGDNESQQARGAHFAPRPPRYDDIVDAAVIEDDDAPAPQPRRDPPRAHASPPPPPPPPPGASQWARDFDDDNYRVPQPDGSAPSYASNAPGPLFGQFAADDDLFDDDATVAHPYVPYSPPVTPPAPPAGWDSEPAVSEEPAMSAGADEHGLATAIGRLRPTSQQRGAVAFTVLGALLTDVETVSVVVVGTSLGMPTAAALTTTRLLVVSERRWKPSVEQFVLRPGLTIHGRHVDDTAAITVQDGDRIVTIDQVSDVAAAVELATATRARASGAGF